MANATGSEPSRAPALPRQRAKAELVAGIDWICHVLWLVRRREPEVLQFQTERGTTGYPHYILSRAGLLPDSEWVETLYVLPPGLVDHLRQRCLALEPPTYLRAALAVGGSALGRISPQPPSPALLELSRGAATEGRLPSAWAALPASGDPHQDWLQAAMVLREGRAFAHYRAASEQGLRPVELLHLSALWHGFDPLQVQRLFRWSEEDVAQARESLRARGWLDPTGGLTGEGRSRRDAIEARTDRWTEDLLSGCTDAELERLAREVSAGQPGENS